MSAEQQRWLAALYEANFAAVSKRCGAILKAGDEAADAAHEVFLIALTSLAPDTEAKRARAWLLTVAQNHCLDVLRRQRRFGRALVTLGADRDARGDLEAGVVDRDFVDGLLRQLSLRERLALWQSAVEHRSLADIASRLQLSYAAAAQVVHRARQHAVRLGAGIAAILAVLRFPRVVRRVLDRMAPFRTDAESLLGAHRLMALAALPVIAAISLQSSTATGTALRPAPAVATATAATSSGGRAAPGGFGVLLAPLNGGSSEHPATVSGGLMPSTGIPPVVTPSLEPLAQSAGPLVPSVPAAGGLGSVPSGPVPGLVVPSIPPVPSLPPTGH